MCWAALELQRQGYDVQIRETINAIWENVDGVPQLRGVKDMDCDVAVFQRVFHKDANPEGLGVSLELLRAVKAQGIGVVVDLDDDLGAIDPQHVGYAFLHDCATIVKEACRIADLVTVSTPALLKRYGNERTVVIPNGIPKAYLGITRKEEHAIPIIGWTGSPLTHVGDLVEVGACIRDLCWTKQATFQAFGNAADATLHQLGIPDQAKIPGVDLANLDYARAYAALDIAIVPLRFSRFNAGKSWLKMIEAASLGVPVVASPSPENARLHEMGVGMLAERTKDWRVSLTALCESADLRLAMAASGRAVASEWTIEERIAPLLWSAWSSANVGSVEKVGAIG